MMARTTRFLAPAYDHGHDRIRGSLTVFTLPGVAPSLCQLQLTQMLNHCLFHNVVGMRTVRSLQVRTGYVRTNMAGTPNAQPQCAGYIVRKLIVRRMRAPPNTWPNMVTVPCATTSC